MHAGPVGEGRGHHTGEPGLDVIGVEHGILGHLTQTVRAMAEHVGIGPHEHAHLPLEGDHATKALGGFAFRAFDQVKALGARDHPGSRCEGRQGF